MYHGFIGWFLCEDVRTQNDSLSIDVIAAAAAAAAPEDSPFICGEKTSPSIHLVVYHVMYILMHVRKYVCVSVYHIHFKGHIVTMPYGQSSNL